MLSHVDQKGIVSFLGVLVAHLLFGYFGSYLIKIGDTPTLIWPATGFAVGVIVIGGYRFTGAIFLSALTLNLWFGHSLLVASIVAAGCAFEGVYTKWFLQKFAIKEVSLAKVKDVILFLFSAVLTAPLIGDLLGVVALTGAGLFRAEDLFKNFNSWWFSDALSALILAPMIVLLAFVFQSKTGFTFEGSMGRLKELISKDQRLEFSLVIFAALIGSSYVFLDRDLWSGGFVEVFRTVYFFFPLVIWTAWRLGALSVVSVMFVIALLALHGSVQGKISPASADIYLQQLNAIQVFIGVCSATGLLLASSLSQFKNSDLKFRSMFELSGVGMAQLDRSGKIMLVNERICSMFGYSKGDLLKLNFEDLVFENDRLSLKNEFEKVVLGESVSAYSERMLAHRSGNGIWVELSVALVSVVGEDSFIGLIVKDIALQKSAALELHKAKVLAEESNNAKSAFLATMSHEIRTPLGVMLGFTDLLKTNSNEEKKSEYLKTIRRNGESLAMLIDDVLDLSKIEAGRLDLFKEPMNVKVLLEEIKTKFVSELRAKDVKFNVNLTGNIPLLIFTDVKRIRQILHNVIGNAVKFTTRGEIDLDISVERSGSSKQPLQIKFLVKDSGCGIAETDKKKLFLPFSQVAKSASRLYGGTGLGLVLSRKLSQLLGGDIELIQSEVGVGSQFLVTIGVGPSDVQSVESMTQIIQMSQKNNGGEILNALLGYKILLAEDTIDQAMLIEIFLSAQGAQTEVASNGEIAVAKALTGDYDFVLMDMQMPVLDGYAATKILRDKGFKKPIFALTAQAMIEDREKCFQVGCDGHIAKPVSQEKLIRSLVNCAVNFA